MMLIWKNKVYNIKTKRTDAYKIWEIKTKQLVVQIAKTFNEAMYTQEKTARL